MSDPLNLHIDHLEGPNELEVILERIKSHFYCGSNTYLDEERKFIQVETTTAFNSEPIFKDVQGTYHLEDEDGYEVWYGPRAAYWIAVDAKNKLLLVMDTLRGQFWSNPVQTREALADLDNYIAALQKLKELVG
jgi:ABC-type Zn2+ transport system substrate-binding protein/surface adhesin